jgi:RNA polymerase sigma factor (sigma-70 family)
MATGKSVTQWIGGLRAAQESAATELWKHFYVRLIGLARKKLRASSKRVVDEEDVVLSAFETFFRRAKEGQFPRLADRDDLWQVLVAITERKAINQLRSEGRLKRGGGNVRGESVFLREDMSGVTPSMDQTVGHEPTPEFAAIVAEDFQRLLEALGDDELREIALLKLEGCSNLEIATKIERSVPTVERRLKLIRRKWREEFD